MEEHQLLRFSSSRRLPFARSSSEGGRYFPLDSYETKCDLPDLGSLLTSMGRWRSGMQADTVGECR